MSIVKTENGYILFLVSPFNSHQSYSGLDKTYVFLTIKQLTDFLLKGETK